MNALNQLLSKISWKSTTRLTIFAMLFAWANILHQLSYPEWIKTLRPIGWLLFIASVGLAIKPTSLLAFVITLILRIVYTAYWTPMIRGHLFLEGLFAVGILLGLAIECGRMRKIGPFNQVEQERLFESFAPFLRLTCLIVYAAVTLSKLNYDFLAPQKSAAVQLLFWTAEKHPWVPTGRWIQEISIWGTLAFEAGIPLLLCFRKTRWLGILSGLFFHSLLAFLPLRISSFTLTMCLLLFVWLPKDAAPTIARAFCRLAERCRMPPVHLAVVLALAAGITGMLFAARRGFNMDMRSLDLGMGIWWWQTAFMMAALWSVRNLPMGKLKEMVRMPSWSLRFYLLFVIFNCLCPYLGLKTRSSLTMHCNLRTEPGYWNNLLLPEAMRIFTYQDHLVEILDSNLPDLDHLREKQMPLPYFEFRRWCRLAEDDFHVAYRRWDGIEASFEKVDGKGTDPSLMQSAGILEKFLCFNPVGASHDYIPGLVNRTGPSRNVVPTYVIP